MKMKNFLVKMLATVFAFVMLASVAGKVNEVQAMENADMNEILSVKCQVTQGVVTDTDMEQYRDKYVMRFVSSIDSLEYRKVGFELSYTDENGKTVTKKNTTKTVFKRIESTTGSTEDGRDTYTFSPKVISTESEYFITAKWPVEEIDIDKDYTVRAFVITKDNETVYGAKRCVSVSDGLKNKTSINLSADAELDKNASYSATYTNNAGESVSIASENFKVLHSEDGVSSVRLLNADKALKSVTEISIKDGSEEVVATVLQRNLYTEYNKDDADTVDTSWYDLIDTDKYIIATSADLYGLAKIANEGGASATKDNFAGKEIYVVSDITVNKETLITESMDDYYTQWRSYNKETGEYTYADAPSCTWTPISEFAGKFYGEGHTISGLYGYSTGKDNLAFISSTVTTTELHNFKLVNSSFIRTTTYEASAPTASLVSTGTGKFSEIYSEALVENTSGRTGGLVGCVMGDNFIMTNCWFNGTVTGKCYGDNTKTGGLIGHLEGTKNEINNCLNSGDVRADVGTAKARAVGGLIGIVHSKASLDIKYSLNTGSIQITAGTTDSVYALLGIQNSAVLTHVYSTPSDGITEPNGLEISKDGIKGTGATSVLPEAFFEEGTWTTVNAHTPVLTSLKSAVIDDSWYDTDKDTFVLYDKADLYGFATLSQETDFAGKTVKLGDDIEVIAGNSDKWGETESRNMWIPIGNTTVPFAGTFDGGLHTIRGVYLEQELDGASYPGGLFAVTGTTAVVRNLYLENSYFNSIGTVNMSNVGSIAGIAQGTFNTIYSNTIVNGHLKGIGGLVGQAKSELTMMNCWFAGSATSTNTSEARLGGLVGAVTNGKASNILIYNCLNTGSLNASQATGSKVRIGGIVGHVASSHALTLENSLNTGTVTVGDGATETYDGLIGQADNSSMKVINCYATKESCPDFGTTSGTPVDKLEITGNDATKEMTSFDFTNIWQTVESSTPTLNFVKSTQSFDTSWYNVAKTEYVLYDKGDLYGLAELSKYTNFAEKTIKLGNDIVVHTGDASTWGTTKPENVRVWEPIGNATTPFAGKFDGNSHTISGIYLETETEKSGFFGFTSSAAEIGNFRLTNSYFESTVDEAIAQFGSIAGVGEGTFEKIYSDATVVAGGQNVGGLIGQLEDGSTMKECWFDGSVESTKPDDIRIGGLVGNAVNGEMTTIENCLNSGTVNGSAANASKARVGGLIGYVPSNGKVSINYCYNTGKVKYNNVTTAYGAIIGGVGPTSVAITVQGNTYSDSESCDKKGYSHDNILHTPRSNRVGDAALTYMTGFDFDTTWSTVPQNTPVLKEFVDVVCDTSWYVGHENEPTYVLYDKADLLGFSMISQTYDFAGKTVKLGADIVVNPGEVSTWDTTALKYHWAPIGNSNVPFAGTFDGNLHTIQGLYIKSSVANTGLFGVTGEGAIVKNLELKNSYFQSSADDLGSIVGSCTGTTTIDTVYSNATVKGSGNRIGGLIGGSSAATTVQYCSYEGSVTNTSTTNKYIGGIIGRVHDAGTAVVQDCLIAGTIDVSANTTQVIAGGVVGATQDVTISNCLMMAELLVNTTTVPKSFGLLTGYLASDYTISNNYGITPDEWTDAIKEKVYSKAKPTEVTVSDVTGDTAKETLEGFDFYTVWSVREGDTPVLNMPRVTLDEYIVRDAADLKLIAALSQTNDFAGKTVKLAANINVNNDEDNQWTPIGNSDVPFAGTFDGQGYTISNLYIDASTKYIGLFAATSPDAVVKHFIVDTATISSDMLGVGVIAGRGHGTFSDIRVENATISGAGRVGGLVGLSQNDVTMSNCSFDGNVTCIKREDYSKEEDNLYNSRYIGGLIGYVSSGNLKISNCMNSGEVVGYEGCTAASPGIGGIVGCVNGATSIEINSCLNAGTVKTDATVAVAGVGPIVGRLDAPGSGFEKYALEKNYTVPCTDLSGIDGVAQVAVDTIKAGAETALPLLDWEAQWESVAGDFPKVRFSQTGFVASASIDVAATSLSNLTTLYPTTRVLKQGDIHAHADNGASSDGTVTLTEWKTQLTNLDMDFASSLDHQSTLHINNGNWDKDLFLYGSEIGVAVKNSDGSSISIATSDGDKTFGVHQNLYFTNETDFKNVLTHSTFKEAFDYLTEFSNENLYNGGNFKLGALRTSTWKEFIQTVRDNNGFYALAHPMIDPSYITTENMDTYLTPYLVDGMGLEVMYMGLGTTNVKNGYQIWKSVLEDGYRVYATAGTDTHKNLQTGFTATVNEKELQFQEALTSFYAEKETDEEYLSEAYVRYLREGNFTAGSVGIQMSVGNTQMGGTGNFEDEYLEIGIGAFHRDAYIEGHQYRVDVWRDNCVVYSQLINPTEEDAEMTAYLRTKADATCKFYRVTVYDVKTNTCIALGNPIWNSAYYTNAQ